jgi:hypothetical protein
MTYQEAYNRNKDRAIFTAPSISPEGGIGRWNCQIAGTNSHGMGTCKESAYKDALNSLLRN